MPLISYKNSLDIEMSSAEIDYLYEQLKKTRG